MSAAAHSLLLPHALAGDAHVVVQRELVAVQHGRPGEPVGLHPALAARPDGLAEGPAGVDGSLQADGGEEGAEEELGVGVTLDVEERDPAHALLGHLVQRVVLHQVGEPHLGVAWTERVTNLSPTSPRYFNIKLKLKFTDALN